MSEVIVQNQNPQVVQIRNLPGPQGPPGAADDGDVAAAVTSGPLTTAALNSTYGAVVVAREFGATGDAVTDDTVALQAAIDAGYTRNVPVFIPAGAYKLTDVLLVRSGQTVYGVKGATQLVQTTAGKACMASHNWVAGNAGPSGHMTLRDLWFIGEGTGAASHGLIARDYLSNFENLIFSSCGGNGLHLTYLDSAGAAYGGSSMVDNRFMDLDARDCKGWGLFLGELDNNKFTDAYLDRVYVSAGTGAPGAIYAGSNGGWQWGKIHTYGQAVPVGMEIYNLNNTSFAQLYIEGGDTNNLRLNRIQRNVTIGSMSARGPAVAGGRALELSKSSLVTDCSVLIGSLNVMQDNAFAYTAVRLDTSTIRVQVSAIGVDGANSALITKVGGTAAASVLIPGDVSVTTPVRTAGETLSVKGVPLALTNRAVWAGSGVKNVALTIPDLRTNSVLHGTLSVVGVRNYNGSHNQKWRADLVLTSKASGDPWYVYTTPILAAAGFTTSPTVTIDKATKTLTVSFEPSDVDAYGAVSYQLEWA